MTISVLVADDSEIMRKVIVNFLKDDPEINLCGEAANFRQTIQLLGKLRPLVVVMDIHMGDEGSVTSSEIKSHLNGSSLVAISVWNDVETRAIADSYGAVAFLDKTNLGIELIPAIKRCAKG